MSHTPHELSEEFPEMTAKIHELKQSDQHFVKLIDEYHLVNREIHRAETDIEPTDDFSLETKRKTRLALKDQIYAILTQ